MDNLNTVVYQLPIEVNYDQLLQEVISIIQPKLNYDPRVKAGGISVTNTAHTPVNNWFNENPETMDYHKDLDGKILKAHAWWAEGYSPNVFTDKIIGYYTNGVSDRELTHWYPDLKNSEMVALKNKIAAYLCIDNQIRCRLSMVPGPFTIAPHSDPHTPWRVHVSLKTDPTIVWKFKEPGTDNVITWHQPPNSVWLIRTGGIEHSVEVPAGHHRWQLFYHIWTTSLPKQYYHQIA